MADNTHVLCYVSGCWAWFTSKPLKEQWGDDWNDAPYEHNAGRPYEPCWHNEPERVSKRGNLCTCPSCVRDWNIDGTPRWTLIRLAFEGPFETPCEGHFNSPYSVQAINAGQIAWLRTRDRNPPIAIPAGVPMDEFIRLVRKAGGRIWKEVQADGGEF